MEIQDEFTNAPISRELKRRARKLKKGLCMMARCTAYRHMATQKCERHLREETERVKAHLKRKKKAAKAENA